MRVVVADDSVLLREGLAQILTAEGFTVVAQAGNAADLLRAVAALRPELAVIDIRMPPTFTDEGLVAARRIRLEYPRVAVLILSQYVEIGYAMDLLSEGAEGVGYLLKDRVSDVHDFAESVRRVAAGGSALDPAVVAQLVALERRADPLQHLTPREREVLALMAEGHSNQGIASALVITDHAVEKHVGNILTKLDLSSEVAGHRRVLAVLTFLRAQGAA